MTARVRVGLLLGSWLAAFAGGCGGAPSLPPRNGVPDYTEKTRAACTDARGQSRPLVVDWQSSDRAEIEARARRGLVVVRYDGCRMDVLKRCTVKSAAAYDYIGLTPKTDRIVMRDADEVYANIPIYAAKFEGKLKQAGSLSVAMTIVGQWDSAQQVPSADMLEGECNGATHVVTALTVGAFEFFAGRTTEAGVGVDVLGAGAGASTASSREVLNRDGDGKSCGAATGEDQKPPFGCGALLRIEVVPIGAARAAEPTCATGTQWDGNQCVAVKADLACADGMVPDKEKGCVAKKPEVVSVEARAVARAPQSSRGVAPVAAECSSLESCTEQCDKGEAKGCLGLGGLLRGELRAGQASDTGTKTEAAFLKACDGGEPTACTALGEMYYQGLGVARNAAASPALFDKACEGGHDAGCNDMGLALSEGSVPRDLPRAIGYFQRACNATSSLGCVGLGMMARDGRGMAKSKGRALEYFQQACRANIQIGCKLASTL